MADRPLLLKRHDLAAALPYAGSILLSAFLLFAIQPMVGRALLPSFGGSPAVWNMALVFFQVLLLGGYAYSHWSVRLSPRSQVLGHAVLLGLPLLLLPPRLPELDPALTAARPVSQAFLALALAAGLPFLVLSSNSSLVQYWYRRDRGQADPYWLYAASNGGSAAALIAYPLLIERLGGLADQARWWTAGYLAFLLLSLVLLRRAWRRRSVGPDPGVEVAADPAMAATSPAPDLRRRLGWALRAALASSLLMGTTLQISTDMAAIPLLWTFTLLLYLLTFMLAFGRRGGALPRRLLGLLAASSIALTLVALIANLKHPVWFVVGLAMAALFFGAWYCHDDLARTAPDPAHLTQFYLWISIGGAAGGLANSLLAPMLLRGVGEYPMALALLAWLIAWAGQGAAPPVGRPGRMLVGALLALGALGLIWAAGGRSVMAGLDESLWPLLRLMPLIVLAGGCLVALLLRRAWPYAVVMSMVALYVAGGRHLPFTTDFQDRSFFGVLRDFRSPRGERMLMHGTTVHGSEWISGPLVGQPGMYFYREGILARLTQALPEQGRMAMIGLGSGALASYLRTGQELLCFEIDPLVIKVAQERFGFLSKSQGAVTLRLGDGRLSLQRDPDPRPFQLIIIDAFSSDAIPTHLLTKEAIAIYAGRLDAKGLLAFHVSSQFFDLEPIIAAAARDLSLHGLRADWYPDARQSAEGAAKHWVVILSPDPTVADDWLQRLDGRALRPAAQPWTDDRIELLEALLD